MFHLFVFVIEMLFILICQDLQMESSLWVNLEYVHVHQYALSFFQINKKKQSEQKYVRKLADLVDDVEKSGDVLLELAAGVVFLGPHAPAITIAPRTLLVRQAARVRACGGRQPIARKVGPDPCQGARPSKKIRDRKQKKVKTQM